MNIIDILYYLNRHITRREETLYPKRARNAFRHSGIIDLGILYNKLLHQIDQVIHKE